MELRAEGTARDQESVGCPQGRRGARALGQVIGTQSLGPFTWLTLRVPGWRKARPGQFALVQWEVSRNFLARALSVAAQHEDEVSFLVAPVGQATHELCRLGKGDRVWVLGPLGRGFDVEALLDGTGRVVVVAGGVGAAPFPLLLAAVREQEVMYAATLPEAPAHVRGLATEPSLEILVLLGFRDRQQAEGARPVQEAVLRLQDAGFRCHVEVATEDGSYGKCGKVTDLLQHYLWPGDRLAVCGPWEMAVAVCGICSAVEGVRAWYSLEANMACGVGSCHGCVIRLASGAFARVCHEGPVFAGENVFGG